MSETRYGFLQTKLGHGGFPTADSLTYQFCSSVLVLFTSRVWWDMLSATSLSGHTRLESQIEPLDYPKWEILCLITFANPTLPLFSVVLEKRRKDLLWDRNTSEWALWGKLNLLPLFLQGWTKITSQVVWKWGEKIAFPCLLYVNKKQIFTQFHTIWEVHFSAATKGKGWLVEKSERMM